MESLCITATNPFSLRYSKKKLLQQQQNPREMFQFSQSSSALPQQLLRVSINKNGNEMMMSKRTLRKKGSGFGVVCYGGGGAGPLSTRSLQWISIISSAILMLSKGTAIHKSFLVPVLALQAPSTIISWIKSEYGIWTAFLAVLVRLFFYIPGELELPFLTLLLVIVAPLQVMNLRSSQEGAVIALVIVGYLAFEHFSRAGNLQKAFEQGVEEVVTVKRTSKPDETVVAELGSPVGSATPKIVGPPGVVVNGGVIVVGVVVVVGMVGVGLTGGLMLYIQKKYIYIGMVRKEEWYY